jgi:hypothetical protein
VPARPSAGGRGFGPPVGHRERVGCCKLARSWESIIGTGTAQKSAVMAAASFEHQGVCKLIAEHPEVLVALVRGEPGQVVPGDVELLPGPETIRELRFPEHNVDTAVVLRKTSDGGLAEAFVSEVQLRPDDDKRWSWPIHVAGTRARLRCPTTLVVITNDEHTARWAAEPIDLGRGGMVLQPIVIGPDKLPRDLDLEQARRAPELAALAVFMHGTKPGSKRLGAAALMAVKEGLDRGNKGYSLLMDVITGCLDERVLKELEMEMEVYKEGEPYGWFFRKLYFEAVAEEKAQGRQEGLRQAIALVLVSRGLVPSPAQIERMGRCTDDLQLQAWLRRACDVGTVEELLEPHRPASMRSSRRSARGGRASRAATASARRSR